jgi:perosamine synthetase
MKLEELKFFGAAPWFPEQDRAEILLEIGRLLESGQLTQGKHLAAFEEACARMANTRFALGVNSGGTALELVLEALELRGGEVIVPTETFVATPNSVVRAGGVPVFSDISDKHLGLTVDTIKARVSTRTRGVIYVPMFGLMSGDLEEVQRFCDQKNLFLIIDAAHAHGAIFNSKPVGSFGIASCFSYYATKILTTGEGGAITTSDELLYEKVKSLRDHGRASDGTTFNHAGNNFRLAEIPALLGCHQHRRLAENVAHRRTVASIYRKILGDSRRLNLVDPAPHQGHAYWRYALLLDPSLDRGAIQKELKERFGVRVTWMYEPLCHLQPVYATGSHGSLKTAEQICSRLINLPTHMGIQEEDAEFIAHALLTVISR